MNTFTHEDLEFLLRPPTGPAVSLFQPTHRPSAQSEEDRLRFKNLLRQAGELLLAAGLRRTTAQEILAPAQSVLDDVHFWKHLSDGLAMFLADGTAQRYLVPLSLEERVRVDRRFVVKPLLPLLIGDGRFYVLALSQNEVRLLEGTREGMIERRVAGMPKSLQDALKFDVQEKQLQCHTGTEARRDRRGAMYHGQGVGIDDAKDRQLRYFRAIDASLYPLLRDEPAPLVLAGVEQAFPLYREVNTSPYLLDEGVVGNPERTRLDDLRRQAWEIARPVLEKAREDALRRWKVLVGSGRTTASIEEILPAAAHGRVDTLLILAGAESWGRFDATEGRVETHDPAAQGDDDLLDLAVLHTLSNRGRVIPVERERMPQGAAAAAWFRY